MKIERAISSYFDNFFQFILTDKHGVILESNDGLFNIQQHIGKNVEDLFPFLIGYIEETNHLSPRETIELNGVQFSAFAMDGYFDIRFVKINNIGRGNNVFISIQDRTSHYKGRQHHHQLRVNKLLQDDLILQQTKVINQQNEVIKTLIRETHHRIKNNLQVIVSLLNFQKNKADNPIISSVIDQVKNRIHTMAVLHEKLHQSNNLKKVDIKEYLGQLVVELVESNSDKSIEISTDIDHFEMDAHTLVPLSLIINELISNSIKHGFSEQDHGKIELKISHLEEDHFRLIMTDDGSGIPDDLFEKEVDSLGKDLIVLFTEQLKGSIKVIENTKGSSIQIDFRLIE